MPPRKRPVDESPAFRIQPDKMRKNMAVVEALATALEPSAVNNDELADAIAIVRKFHEELERLCQLRASSTDDSSSTSSSTVQTDSAETGDEAVQNCPTGLNDTQQSGGWRFLKPVEDYDQRRWLKIGENPFGDVVVELEPAEEDQE